MLKLTVKPGEYIQISHDIKVIFTGGSSNNIHILIDAPKKYNIVRSKLMEEDKRDTFYKDNEVSELSILQTCKLIKKDKERQKSAEA